MAADNKSLGRFTLTGIPSAPRGVPQIEVSFDIDANGIVHVSAKDLGTGNSQNITITASTNLSDADIDKAVKEAEQFAEQDKKRKEEVEVRNNADSMVNQTEKAIEELGGKIDAGDKSTLEGKLNAVKEALKGTDNDAIKAATDDLSNTSMNIFGKVYQNAQGAQAGAQGAAGAGAGAGANAQNDDVVDADYEVVDDEDKK